VEKVRSFANIKAIDGPLDQVALPQMDHSDFVIIHLTITTLLRKRASQ
jgi:hypothetical protein